MKLFIKKIIFLGILCLIILTTVFYIRLYSGNLYPEFKTLRKALADNVDIIFLGSSVDRSTDVSDTDKRAISEMLNDITLDKNVVGISHPAYQLDIFSEIIKYIAKHKKYNYPTIIVPINLRSFAPGWNYEPTYQFLKEKYYLQELPYLSFFNYKGYEEFTEKKYRQIPIYFNGKEIEVIFNKRPTNNRDSVANIKLGFISYYMQEIESHNRKLQKLTEIDKIAKDKGIRIILYISPIDIQRAEKLNVENFRRIVINNIEIIKKAVKYSKLIDLSFKMESTKFNYELSPNEHLDMQGRLELAETLATELVQK